jgi:hypothetical protein
LYTRVIGHGGWDGLRGSIAVWARAAATARRGGVSVAVLKVAVAVMAEAAADALVVAGSERDGEGPERSGVVAAVEGRESGVEIDDGVEDALESALSLRSMVGIG